MNIYFKNFGCKLNLAELQEYEYIAQEFGIEIINKIEKADIVLINSCHVTQKSFEKILSFLSKKINSNQKIILAGCYPTEYQFPGNYHLLFGNKKKMLIDLLKKLIITKHKFSHQKINLSKTRAFIKIQQGCNTCCSYCIIPFYRGKSTSKSVFNIISKIDCYLGMGVKEIVLTGTNLGKYKYQEYNLAGLLKEILRRTTVQRLRISSIDVSDINSQLLKVYSVNQDRICSHFHLALQSGSDKILKSMRRPYDSEKYLSIINQIYEILPNANITTDIIIGFPQETTSDFLSSCEMIKKVNFAKTHIFSYSEHPKTLSAQIYPKVSFTVIKQRYQHISRVSRQISKIRYDKFVGTYWPVLYEGKQTDYISGYTSNYLPVRVYNFNKHKSYRNQVILTKIISTSNNYILGEILTT